MIMDAAIRIVLTYAEGYTLPIRFNTSPRKTVDRHTQVCRVQMFNQNLSLAIFGTEILRSGTPSSGHCRMLYIWELPMVRKRPMGFASIRHARYPILKETNNELSPFPFQGNVVVWYG
jgi:hypothetical protein